MIGKLISTGFSLATLPARLTFRSVRALAMTPAEASRLLADMRQASDQAVQELQGLLANVDADMTHKNGAPQCCRQAPGSRTGPARRRTTPEHGRDQHSAGRLADASLDAELAAKRA